jgi:hypothetical protein
VVRGSGSASCERLNSITHEDDGVGEEELLDIYVGSGDELGPCDVASSEVGRVVETIGNDEDFTGLDECVEAGDEGLGLTVCDGEGINGFDFLSGNEIAKGAAKSELADGLWNLLGVVARAWAEDDTTTDKDRGAFVAVASTTGAFLFVDLAVVTGDLAPGLGASGAGAAVGAVGDHEIVDGLATFLGTYQHEVGGLSVFCGESLSGHDSKS